MKLKEEIYSACTKLLNQKIQELTLSLRDLMKDGEGAKSSAGDKHETGRAMMQLEYEKIANQLQKVEAEKKLLEEIDISRSSSNIIRGSLIETDRALFFLSTAIGEIVVDKKPVIVLSPKSPLGQKLLGLSVNDKAEMNGTTYLILKIM